MSSVTEFLYFSYFSFVGILSVPTHLFFYRQLFNLSSTALAKTKIHFVFKSRSCVSFSCIRAPNCVVEAARSNENFHEYCFGNVIKQTLSTCKRLPVSKFYHLENIFKSTRNFLTVCFQDRSPLFVSDFFFTSWFFNTFSPFLYILNRECETLRMST